MCRELEVKGDRMTRRITLACRFQAQQSWPVEDYELFKGDDLHGKTMGMVGYGSINREIARMVKAMGMRVLACKRDPKIRREDGFRVPGTGDPAGKIPEAWFGIERLTDMLRQTDIAMITLPLTNKTRGLIGRRELEALPLHAYLVNIGRGFILDEAVLAKRLKEGKLAGAAMDVFGNEPLEPESPLWKAPNMLIMPHIGSWTKTQALRASEVLIENISRDLKGKQLINLVDVKRMY